MDLSSRLPLGVRAFTVRLGIVLAVVMATSAAARADFLYTFERSARARQRPPAVGSVHGAPVLLANPVPAAALP